MNKAMFWPCAVVGLLAMNVTIVGITVYQASSNTTMVPEPRYYERALRVDEQVAQRATNERLGWTAEATISTSAGPRLSVRLRDRSGAVVRDAQVHADVIPNLRPRSRAAVVLSPTPEGDYTCTLPSNQSGLWTLRIEAHRGADVFTNELQAMMPVAAPAAGAAR